MDFAEYAAAIEPSTMSPKLAAFAERVHVVSSWARGVRVERSLATPLYLTDLGVRHSKDPGRYFAACVAHMGFPEPHVAEESEAALRDVDRSRLGAALDAYVLLVGDYISASRAARSALERSHRNLEFETGLMAGVLLGAVGDRLAIAVLHEAAQSAPTHSERLTCRHRAAMVHCKRFKEYEAAGAILSGIIDESNKPGNDDPDLFELHSIAQNGLALIHAMRGRVEDARSSMETALSGVIERVIASGEVDGRLGRYYLQEMINSAHLDALAKDFDVARSTLEEIDPLVREWVPGYLGEYLGVRGFLAFRVGDYRAAVSDSLLAGDAALSHGGLSAFDACRSVVIASLLRLGQESLACDLANQLDVDPLGFAFALRRDDVVAAI